MNNKEHVIILVVGRTASGKSTLIKNICDRTCATQLKSFTTRPQRNEQDIDHIFVDEEYYQAEKDKDNIIAETCIADAYYFATKEQIYNADFYTIDPVGIKMLKSMNLPDIRFVTVYIKSDEDIREHRATEIRHDDKSVFRQRSFSESSQFREFVRDEAWDYAISNDKDLAKAYTVLRYIALIEGVFRNHMEVENNENND